MKAKTNILLAWMLILPLVLGGPVNSTPLMGLSRESSTDVAQVQPPHIQDLGRVVPAIARPSIVSTKLMGDPGAAPHLSPLLDPYQPDIAATDGREAIPAQIDRPASTCTVRSKNDSGSNTLRSCLQNAVTGDVITFDPAVFPPGSPQAILVDSELPRIVVDNLTVDGSNAGVILDGSRLSSSTTGLWIDGRSGVTVRGLQIRRFGWGMALWQGARNCTIGGSRSIGSGPLGQGNLISGNGHAGIDLQGANTTGNTVAGNFIGTNLAGSTADGNDLGILVTDGASKNVIGGSHTPGVCDGPCNVISGNLSRGIALQFEGTDDNRILGNFIGTDVSGIRAIANNDGITIGAGASSTQIGGTASGEGNLVSGNTNIGIWISWKETVGNTVTGNFVGTDVTGAVALPNYDGILVSGSTDNRIGGTAPGARNLISGNEYVGLWLELLGAPGNVVAGNTIGSDAGGTIALPNYTGIVIGSASNNLIGGTVQGAGNLISGNTTEGVHIQGSSTLNSLQGNFIGTDLAGEEAIPNGMDGIAIAFGASNNQVGGSASGAGNLISGNSQIGIRIDHDDTIGNRVEGNTIGTNRAGTRALPNLKGVLIIGGPGTVVGGAHTPWVCDGPCNLISGNGFGVIIQGVGMQAVAGSDPLVIETDMAFIAVSGQGVQVLGNFIGTDLTGTHALANEVGIGLWLQATGNRIGSGTPGEGNLISGNLMGIEIVDPGTTENVVLGNRMGTTANGEAPLPNGGLGVFIADGAYGNCVGGAGPGEGNLISGHATTTHDYAIQIQNAPTPGVTRNCVVGNLIGTDWTGMRAIPNSGGVLLIAGPTYTQIQRNVISGNLNFGIEADGAETKLNTMADNLIGVAADGETPLPNGVGVIFFDANHNKVGPANTIAYNHDFGVVPYGPNSVSNTITQSRIYGNGLGQIAFLQVPEPLAPAPFLTAWDSPAVSGTACALCVVEVFSSRSGGEGGRTYLGSTTADATGRFSLAVGSDHTYLTATATDSEGTTSEFAESLLVGHAVYLPVVQRASR